MARRGVDVVILPSYLLLGVFISVVRYTKPACRVKIYAWAYACQSACDGVWACWFTNLDWRSFLHNDEINAVILGRGFAAQMEAMFADDLKESKAIALEEWKHRSWMLRLKEQMARLGAYWL
jgi:cardiolipin synthase